MFIAMKKLLFFILPAITALAVSCESISIVDTADQLPQVQGFSPQSAPVGAEIIVTGEYLSNVTKAFIGSKQVEISQKVSNTRLSLRVVEGTTGGKIRLVNAVGEGESPEEFKVSFAVPSLKSELIQTSAEMGAEMMIIGENLNSAYSVVFTADGYKDGHVAEMVSRNDKEIVVKVPYVEDASAAISMTYSDGSKIVPTDPSKSHKLSIIRYVPMFDAHEFEGAVDVGLQVVLTGTHLDKVDAIYAGDVQCNMTKTESQISFSIPEAGFPEGETPTQLKATYFDENETKVLAENFVVNVPKIKFWQAVTTYGHSCYGELKVFFSPETGKVYHTSEWQNLDPLAKERGTKYTGSQNPGLSEADYNTIPPYFFCYSNNACDIIFYSPANSNSIFKNMPTIQGDNSTKTRIPGNNTDAIYGSTVLTFRALNASNAAEKAIIDKVLNKELKTIDEQSFPIDANAHTVAGVSCTNLVGTINDKAYAPGLIADADRKVDKVYDNIDAVIMVLYHDYRGAIKVDDPANPGTKITSLENIKRIGFIRVRKINFKIDQTNSNKPASLSEFTYDCYWQKHDYDYSKITK